MVKIYSKQNCPACKMTKRFLNENKIPYEEFDILANETSLNEVKKMGYQTVPVIVFEDMNFDGFRPMELNKIKAKLQFS